MKNEALEIAVAGAASKASWIVSLATAAFAFVSSNTGATITGIAIAVATFIVNSYYKRKDDARKLRRDAREQAMADAYIRKMERSSGMAPLMDLGDDE